MQQPGQFPMGPGQSPVPQGPPPTIVTLINASHGTLLLDDGVTLRYGTIPQGQTVKILDYQIVHPMIVTSMQRGWLIQEGTPAAQSYRQAQAPQSLSYVGGGTDFVNQVPGPGLISFLPPGAEGVNLPGVVGRGPGFDDSTQAPAEIADAQGIITGGRSAPDQTVIVPDADQILRNAARSQNTMIPPYQPTGGPLNAQQVLASRPNQGGYNAAFNPQLPQPQPMAPQPTQPPFMQNLPTPNVAQYVPQQVPQQPQYQHMGQQIVRQGNQVGLQQVIRPGMPQSGPLPKSPQMGQLIIGSEIPGGGQLRDIGEMSAGVMLDVEQQTTALLKGIEQGNRNAQILLNYKEWPEQKKLFFIAGTKDLEMLYKLFHAETSGTLSMYIQNRIVQLGGQVPAYRQPIQTAPAPAIPTVPQNVLNGVLLQYPDWDETSKLAFIANVSDPELLMKLQKREPSAQVNIKIAERITQVQGQINVEEFPAGLPGAIVDKGLPTKLQGEPIVQQPATQVATPLTATPAQTTVQPMTQTPVQPVAQQPPVVQGQVVLPSPVIPQGSQQG